MGFPYFSDLGTMALPRIRWLTPSYVLSLISLNTRLKNALCSSVKLRTQLWVSPLKKIYPQSSPIRMIHSLMTKLRQNKEITSLNRHVIGVKDCWNFETFEDFFPCHHEAWKRDNEKKVDWAIFLEYVISKELGEGHICKVTRKSRFACWRSHLLVPLFTA